MSKIAPMQAEALGLKPAPKNTVTVATPVVAGKAPAAKNMAVTKAKPAISKVTAKPVTKLVAKPVAKAKPKASKNNNPKKDDKKAKPEKIKMERDSFTMPKDEYAQLSLLKARLMAMGQPAKKSELLRAGVKLLAAMSDNTLKTTLAKIPVIKTGRPNK